MVDSISIGKKPLVGFFPLFYNLAETGRAVLIAKRYKEIGGEVVFFSHGGKYEHLAKNIGCEVIHVNPIYSEEFIDFLWKSSRLETFKNPFTKKNLIEHVDHEVAAFKKTGIKLIVSTNNFPCSISGRVAKIPVVFVTPRIPFSFTRYPEDAEFLITRILPKWLKLKILNWYFPHSKGYSPPFIKVAKKYNVPPPKKGIEVNRGDYTLFTEFKELINENDSKSPHNEYYIGPIVLDELISQNFDRDNTLREEEIIYHHINKINKSILVTLGSSGTKEILLQILNTLNKTDYSVIAVYTSILQKDELPIYKDNILLKKFIPSMEKLTKLIDLIIIHGGQGTVYTAAYAGKPIIGFPMQFEQHLNLEMLLKQKMGFIASRKHFKEKELLGYINEIFKNYDFYLKNAQNLSKKLPQPNGAKNAVEIIIKILDKKEV